MEWNRKSLASAPFFSCIPYVQIRVIAEGESPGSVCVYRDASVLQEAKDAVSALVNAVAFTENKHLCLVGGKILAMYPGMPPVAILKRFRVGASVGERKKYQARVIATWSRCYASGGYPFPQNPIKVCSAPSSVLVLHTGCPQLHNCDESVEFLHADGTLDESRVCAAWQKVTERVLLAACQESTKSNMRIHLKIPPLGAFLYHPVYGARCPRGNVMECALRGLQMAVTSLLPRGLPIRVSCIELPDFTREGFYTPEDSFVELCAKCGIKVISGWMFAKDALDASAVQPGSVMAVAIAGDALALPGNRRGYVSVESMVANNTSFRRDASWVYNPNMISDKFHSQLGGALIGENRSSARSGSKAAGTSAGTGSASSARASGGGAAVAVAE